MVSNIWNIGTSRRRALQAALACAGAFSLPARAQAQTADYPKKPVRFVVPFAAGGSDTMARAIADKLSPLLKQPVLVENKPGAAALIGSEYVANAPADGYTILFLGGGSLTPVLYKDLRFEILKALRPVICIARGGMTFMVAGSVPAGSFKEFVAYARKQPGKLNYSHTAGSIVLSTEMLKSEAGFDAVAVPYKGSSQVITGLLGNEVQMAIDVPFAYLPMIKEGRIRPLVHGGQERSPSLPDVPTLAELGMRDLLFAVSYGVWAPAGTPDPIVAQLNAAFNQVLKDPEIRERLAQASVLPVGGRPEVHAEQIALEQAMWARAAKQIGYTPQ